MENKDKTTPETGSVSGFKEKWSNMTGKDKTKILVGGVIAVAVGAVVLADQNSPSKEERDAKSGKSTQIATQIVSPVRKDISREDMMRALTQLQNTIDKQDSRLNNLENSKDQNGSGTALDVLDRASNLTDNSLPDTQHGSIDVVSTKTDIPVGMGNTSSSASSGNAGNGSSAPPAGSVSSNGSSVPPAISGDGTSVPPAISSSEQNTIPQALDGSSTALPTLSENSSQSGVLAQSQSDFGQSSYWKKGSTSTGKKGGNGNNTAEKKYQTDGLYIPSNAIFRVVSVTGLNAPTSEQSEKTPMPVILRVKQLAQLPNRVTADLQDCMIGGVGYGQMSDERVMIRVTNISCMNRFNQPLEASIQGTLYGEDGKVGYRGRMVSKTGEVISQMIKVAAWSVPAQMLVGLASNIEVGKTNKSSNTSVYLNTGKATSDAANIAANGVSNIFNEIAGIYKQYAAQTFPVIEVNPGRYGTVVITNGFKLQLAGQDKK